MINSFGDSETELIYKGQRSKKLPPTIHNVSRRKLRMIAAAKEVKDLRIPPGNNLEQLVGNLAGFWSIRIIDQWRIVFTFEKLPNIHPGEILKEEFLVPMNISAYRLAKEINIPQTRISEIIHGNRSITADTAIRFSRFFGTTAEFWLNLQNLYDLEEEENKHAPEFDAIKVCAYA